MLFVIWYDYETWRERRCKYLLELSLEVVSPLSTWLVIYYNTINLVHTTPRVSISLEREFSICFFHYRIFTRMHVRYVHMYIYTIYMCTNIGRGYLGCLLHCFKKLKIKKASLYDYFFVLIFTNLHIPFKRINNPYTYNNITYFLSFPT